MNFTNAKSYNETGLEQLATHELNPRRKLDKKEKIPYQRHCPLHQDQPVCTGPSGEGEGCWRGGAAGWRLATLLPPATDTKLHSNKHDQRWNF
jgi:hypothetical protein